MFDFDGQVVIVTGSGSPKGIGKTIAKTFAKQKAAVVIADINEAGIQDTVNEIKSEGGEAMGVVVNVTSEESVQNMVKEVMDAYGRLDVLINNAGISQKVTVEDMTLADIRKIFEVNMYGLFLCTQACMKPMREAKYGRIVNLSSVSGKRGGGVFGGAHYSASKAAVLAFSKNLSREISAEGITINSVCPGLIDTEIWKSLPKEEADQVISQIPMGRPGQTQEVADTIVFLASKEASYITGEEIDINGGSHMD
ncbi:SDR family NAD(P)-dependent oxidoreductase [Faecalicatena contorta]|uniref:NAD(P)-dependent dehydrogenase, short-chain alcohol dehydrogenase family n=1 Tax=Faecalicatena contorta TaxID=39482 RepID=A0A315ZTE5_9FIRM|nr:SDR family NAD(P)-dependent oxidoreductase [Faecalicatena contorta]PWJ48582.1 NAD(P)-dependent dehydrogenase (short-subunit alcohol dehydrogenase family) [Faecalicatena contorta]SUQ15318.1 NAD(P)-dependent dehydrogenase, short-chain alcohol dehydrogenase family [Faecalicatena contorta]